MFKILNCLIGIANSDHLVIFKFPNCMVDLKDNFLNKCKKSNARRFPI